MRSRNELIHRARTMVAQGRHLPPRAAAESFTEAATLYRQAELTGMARMCDHLADLARQAAASSTNEMVRT